MELTAVLNNVRSVHNVGSIFRTASAAGVKTIYLCGITPGPLDRFGKPREQFIKVSLGGEKYVKWAKFPSVVKLIGKLKKSGCKVFAVEQSHNARPYYRWATGNRRKATSIALVFGNEVNGLPKSVLSMADKVLEIPLPGQKESLNVAVAFGIAVFRLLYK